MLCCNNCIINPICKIGCKELLENINLITTEDFNRNTKLPKRLISISILNKNKIFYLKLECNILVRIDKTICEFTKNGKLHRDNGPAIEHANGYKH